LFLPQFNPYHENLHTHYLNLSRLIEFLKSDLFTGYVQIKGAEKEFLIFLEDGQILSSIENTDDEYKSLPFQDVLNAIGEDESVNIYHLPQETAPFWANLATAEVLYPGLSSDFTVLLKLIHKLKQEKLTGWIESRLSEDEKSLVYFKDGKIMGTCSSWRGFVFDEEEKHLSEVIEKSSEGVFNVYKLLLDRVTSMALEEIINFYQEYLHILEKTVGHRQFSLSLRQKCVEKAEKYPFLDPFANELEFKEGKLSFVGDASERQLLEALKEVCVEIIKEKGLEKKIDKEAGDLKEKYKVFLENTGLSALLAT